MASGFLKSKAPSKVLTCHSVMLGRDAVVGKDVECYNRKFGIHRRLVDMRNWIQPMKLNLAGVGPIAARL
jgi:hypothetical protein